MVELHIMVEGGGQPCDTNASIACNTQVLRQSLHSFFSRLLGRTDISISLSLEFSYRNAVKQFLNKDGLNMFVDLDAPKADMQNWFKKLETENPNIPLVIPESKRCNVYFMVQEMEAWFLKQPQCFERWAEREGWTRRQPDELIEEHSLICGKNIEDITKPCIATANLMRHFFEKKTAGEKRKLAKYNKLTTASVLLDALDAPLLESMDTELQRFKKQYRAATA